MSRTDRRTDSSSNLLDHVINFHDNFVIRNPHPLELDDPVQSLRPPKPGKEGTHGLFAGICLLFVTPILKLTRCGEAFNAEIQNVNIPSTFIYRLSTSSFGQWAQEVSRLPRFSSLKQTS